MYAARSLTSIKGLVWGEKKNLPLSGRIGLLTVYYTVEIALTTSSQFMTFTQPHSDSR